MPAPRRCPVNALSGLDGLGAVVDKPLDRPVYVKVIRNGVIFWPISLRSFSAPRSPRGADHQVPWRLSALSRPIQPVRLVGAVIFPGFKFFIQIFAKIRFDVLKSLLIEELFDPSL